MPMQRLLRIAAFALLASSTVAVAADAPSKTPTAANAVGLRPIEFTEYDLDNGLHVILHENHEAPVIASYVLYHVGSKNEQADRTGFAHFFEHLMFEGSENIPRGGIDKLVSSAGGNLNASTSFDQTDYYINLPSNQMKLALWIESERMLHGKVEKVGVETQREVVKEERRRNYDNRPYGTLFENLAAMVFKGTPYQWTPIGSFEYIDKAALEEFQTFYKSYYVPNNATLSIAGDFKTDELKKQIAEYFGPIPKGEPIVRPDFALPPQTAPDTRSVEKENTPLPATLHAWQAARRTDPDRYALDLLTNILAVGHSSRLAHRLVDQEQVALDVAAFPYLLERGGMVGVLATGNQGVAISKLDGIIDEEIDRVRKEGVTEEEFEKAINGKSAAIASAYGTMASRAQELAASHVFFGEARLINTELDRYLAVKREDLQRVANLYFKPEGLNTLHYPVAGKTAETKAEGPTK